MIVLASQSTGRLATLRAAGIEPDVRVSEVDEPAVLAALARRHRDRALPAPGPAQQVQELAYAKAFDVAHALAPGAPADELVIGCDSMLEIDGQVVGKPASPAVAVARWQRMRARSGVLHTGHCVVRLRDLAYREAVSSTVVHFGSPTDEEIAAYVATGEPLWCAGAFTIDGLGGAFIEGVEGDPHGVVGLSLPLVRTLVTQLGVRWTDLWNRREQQASVADAEDNRGH